MVFLGGLDLEERSSFVDHLLSYSPASHHTPGFAASVLPLLALWPYSSLSSSWHLCIKTGQAEGQSRGFMCLSFGNLSIRESLLGVLIVLGAAFGVLLKLWFSW